MIAYDSQAGANASRLWWLLNYVGHEKIYILDGGFPAWKENGLPITTEIPVAKRKAFKANVQRSYACNDGNGQREYLCRCRCYVN